MTSPSTAEVEQEGNVDFIFKLHDDLFYPAVEHERSVEFISNLDDDILWRIFMMNAEAEASPGWRLKNINAPLVVAWSCSHVCGRWRDVILHSPSLWGRLIDLDLLAVIKPEWQSEILRRTGGSPLTVSGQLPADLHLFQAEGSLLWFILENHWSRIESLTVAIDWVKTLRKEFWAFLFQPAPRLRIIDIKVDSDPLLPFTHASQQLFNGYAPRLESVRLRSFAFTITPNTPWISRITSLNVRNMKSMSITDWLKALAEMPLITSLTLLQSLPRPPDTQAPVRLRLPNLSEIYLSCHSRAWAVFLEQITPAPTCKMRLSSEYVYRLKQYSAQDSLLIKRCLSRYSHSFFKNQNVEYLSLKIRDNSFWMTAALCEKTRTAPLFDVEPYGKLYAEPISGYFEPFFGCNFNYLTTFYYQPPWDDSTHSWQENFLTFLSALVAVEKVITNFVGVEALQYFNQTRHLVENSDLAQTIIFPKLQTLRVEGFSRSSAETLALFLSSRRDLQAPLEVLDITSSTDPTNFDSFTGMKVIYRVGTHVGQHVCGTSKSKDTWIKQRHYGSRWYNN